MIYLFWLPILLFVGFWAMLVALPVATGLSLFYSLKIAKAINDGFWVIVSALPILIGLGLFYANKILRVVKRGGSKAGSAAGWGK
jgi:hypothetical protein